jgi:hypothetical protein
MVKCWCSSCRIHSGSTSCHLVPWCQGFSTSLNSWNYACFVWKCMCFKDEGDGVELEVTFRAARNEWWGMTRPGPWCHDTQECCKSRGSRLCGQQMLEHYCTSSAVQYEHLYCAHNRVMPRILQGVCPVGPTNAQRWSQVTAYDTVAGAFSVLPGRGHYVFAVDCGGQLMRHGTTTFNPWENL